MMEETVHIPVLEREVCEYLQAERGGRFIDCTLGGGGHTIAILKSNPANTVVAVDRDLRALDRARERLKSFGDRVKLVHGRFSKVTEVVSNETFDGMLVDLGISTDQLKENRGFSFGDSAELDMRMDESESISARDIVNNTSERELFLILKKGGVGSEAKTVAHAIVQARPITETRELARVINTSIAGQSRKKQTNPSTVVFQAIRIAVNGELQEIEELMAAAPTLVRGGGRLAMITFHSLEDQLVTSTMRSWEQAGDFPASWRGPRGRSLGKMVERKAVAPSEEETTRNASSRSARLRVFEFIQ